MNSFNNYLPIYAFFSSEPITKNPSSSKKIFKPLSLNSISKYLNFDYISPNTHSLLSPSKSNGTLRMYVCFSYSILYHYYKF